MKSEKTSENKKTAYEIPTANILIVSNEDRFILTSGDDDSGSSSGSGSGSGSWGPLTPLSLYPW